MTTSIKVDFEIGILAAFIQHAQVPDTTPLKITWVRGSKSIDTETKQLKGNRVVFNDKFQMKTKIELDEVTQKLSKKETQLKLIGDDNQVIGTTILDLGKYALKAKTQDRLMLFMVGDEDQNSSNQSYIEVIVKAAVTQEGSKEGNPADKKKEDTHEELNTVLKEIQDIKRMNSELEAQLEVKLDQQKKLEIKAGCTQIE